MKAIKVLIFIYFIFFTYSCSNDQTKKTIVKEKDLELQVLEAYNEGKKALESGDVLYAAKKFNEAEILFPQSQWAPKSVLMASYSYYMQSYYSLAIENIKRYFKTYPNDKNKAYAHYLLAICYYETIEGEKKDLAPLILSKNEFNFVISDQYILFG